MDKTTRLFDYKSAPRYLINDKTYVQTPLVLGQVRQLLEVLKDFRLPEEFTAPQLMELLGPDRLPAALAVVLTEEGKSPRDKDIAALAADLEFSITAEMALQVVNDFFACNPISSLLAGMRGALGSMMTNLAVALKNEGEETGSKTSSAS
ncbi:MAG: hypothetical protein HPY65_07775 [Syntrophaceae bacterium]|nr:hypothetical protein [Syntrophaceae bacterium]